MDSFRRCMERTLWKVPMAKVVWTEEFHLEFDSCLEYASITFGKSTAKKWADEIAKFEHRASLFPTSYSPEHLLEGKRFLYRSCQVMSRRFKLIFYYDEVEGTIHLVDIWDTRMNPQALIRRIK